MKRAWCLLALALVAVAAQAEPATFKQPAMKGWRLGLQTWTFHQTYGGKKHNLLEIIDMAKDLGIEYLEAAGGWGPGMSPTEMAKVQAKLNETGIKIVQIGVGGIPNDEPGARRAMEWCKKVGVEAVSLEPDPKVFPMLDRLTKEYGIKIAVHDHPKPSRYWDPQFLLDNIKDCNPLIGSCADTGHWVRSGLDPVECLKKLAGRIISLHFKDLNKKSGGSDVPWGTGISNAKGQLEELKRQNFQGLFSIEYEKWDKDQFENVRKCVEWFHATAAELAK